MPTSKRIHTNEVHSSTWPRSHIHQARLVSRKRAYLS